MVEVILEKTGESKQVTDGEDIQKACKEFGVPIGCGIGVCGVCSIEIMSGEENLSDLTEQELDMSKDEKNRLACQCQIKSGKVKFKF